MTRLPYQLLEHVDGPQGPLLLERMALSDDPALRAYALGDPNCTPAGLAGAAEEIVARLAGEPAGPRSVQHAQALAANPSAPPQALAALSSCDVPEVVSAVASSPCCPPALLAVLAGSRHWTVRHAVASRPDAPPAVLEALSADRDSGVREAVLSNPGSPQDVLERLLGTMPDLPLLRAAARNPRFGAERVDQWAENPAPSLRRILAGHPSLPPARVAEFAWDARDEVCRAAAAAHPCLPPDNALPLTSALQPRAVREALAGNLRLPVEVNARLLVDPDPSVRRIAAGDPRLSPGALDTATLGEYDRDVLASLAANPSLPLRAQMHLVVWAAANRASGREAVEDALARREDLDPEVIEALAGGDHDRATHAQALRRARCPQRLLDEALRSPEPALRAAVASRPDCPDAVLRRLAMDPEDYVRVLVALHPNCGEETAALCALSGSAQ